MFDGQRVLVTGSTGFLGRHVCGYLERQGADVYLHQLSKGMGDLRAFPLPPFLRPVLTKNDLRVVHLAYPGSKYGIETSLKTPFSLAADLLRMDANVIQACGEWGVSKLLCCGSVCSYPEATTLPTNEAQLWQGYPEPVNAAYGMAKRMQLTLLQAARQQYGLNGIHLILANMYGPGDRSGHVIPSLIRKVRHAKATGGEVVVWGRPDVSRSFLYVEDAAEGIGRALAGYDSPDPLNLCSREEVTMQALVEQLAWLLDYPGPIQFDTSRPTGHLRRQFDTSRLQAALGWSPSTPFAEGLRRTVAWHLVQPEAQP